MKGIRPEWENLPKRKCDNCGTPYRPKRPPIEGQRGFCQPNCRKEYAKRGGTFSKLKPFIGKEVIKEVRRAVRERNPLDAEWQELVMSRLAMLEKTVASVRQAFLLDFPEKN